MVTGVTRAALAIGLVLLAGTLGILQHGSATPGRPSPRAIAITTEGHRPQSLPHHLGRPSVQASASAPARTSSHQIPSAGAAVQLSAASLQQGLINADRARAGLGPLAWSPCLASIATQSARRMAAQGAISHAGAVYQSFGCDLGSRQSGENVGFWSLGANDPRLNTMFMNSPEHRANILGPYRYVGTAWAVAPDGYAYIAVEFA